VDAARYDDLRGRLMGLLIRLGDRLDLKTQEWTQEFVDHNELGLALETMADALSEAGASIADQERAEILVLVAEMKMSDRVAGALTLCTKSA
jgi:hypothetical protein